MSDRVPTGRHGDWRERRLQEALERGDFENLPGAGKPLTGLGRPLSPGDWAVRWARRTGADLTAALPLALAMRREREQLVAAVPTLGAQAQVRTLVADFNVRLDRGYRTPQADPPLAVPFLDVEVQVARWVEAHPQVVPEEPVQARPVRRPVRRWGRRQR